MENFVLYDEIGRSDGYIMYKGRRKGSITFLAICCVEKGRRAEITNHVRFVHEMMHDNVVRFLEWYETSNHLWLVLELNTGGSLATILSQDGHLPECTVRRFGADIVRGLHYIHSQDIVFADLQPSKLMLDGSGSLKYGDFSIARKVDENLFELFDQFLEGSPDIGETTIPEPALHYVAPEVLKGTTPSFESDIWSLGCVVYEMYTGLPPFTGESPDQLAEQIVYSELSPPRVRSGPQRVSGKCSPELSDLLCRILVKEPSLRLRMSDIVLHPFWQDCLVDLVSSGSCELDSTLPLPETSEFSVSSVAYDAPHTLVEDVVPLFKPLNSAHGNVHSTVSQPATERLIKDCLEERPRSVLDIVSQPKSATELEKTSCETQPILQASFTLRASRSSRGGALTEGNSSISSSPTKNDVHLVTLDVVTEQDAPLSTADELSNFSAIDQEESELLMLVTLDHDSISLQIADNSRIQKPISLKFDAKSCPVAPFSPEKLLAWFKDGNSELSKHIRAIYNQLTAHEKGPPSQKRLHFLNYVISVVSGTGCGPVALRLLEAGLLPEAVRQFRETSHLELRVRLGRLIGVSLASVLLYCQEDERCSFAKVFDDMEWAPLSEIACTLAEILRENFRNVKVKLAVLPPLGQILCTFATVERDGGFANCAVSVMATSHVVRCLQGHEDATVSHLAAKTVETVLCCGSHSVLARRFSTPEVAQLLWSTYTHATSDSLRVTAMSALFQLTKLEPSVWQPVIDKVGLTAVLSALQSAAGQLARVQQYLLSAFCIYIIQQSPSTLGRRFVQDRDLLAATLCLLESPSTLVRAKAFLLLRLILAHNINALVLACTLRLVMYVERDLRRGTSLTPSSGGNTARNDASSMYLMRCLKILVDQLCAAIPHISSELLTALSAVAGRRHPSNAQVRALKQCLPLAGCLLELVSSATMRNNFLNNNFIEFLGKLLDGCKVLDCGETQLDTALGRVGATEELQSQALGLLEILAAHGPLITEHATSIVRCLLPPLCALAASSNINTRVVSLKLCADVVCLLCAEGVSVPSNVVAELWPLLEQQLLPLAEALLLDPEPAPCHTLRLLSAAVDQWSDAAARLQSLGLISLLVQLLAEQIFPATSEAMLIALTLIGQLAAYKETKLSQLISDHDLFGVFCQTFVNVSDACLLCDSEVHRIDPRRAAAFLQALVDALNALLRHVSDVVRRALQSKKASARSGGPVYSGAAEAAQEAESLLLTARSVTDMMGVLTQLLVHEDPEVAETALKALSNIASLYGGENPDALNFENTSYYAQALSRVEPRKQRLILRILKRLITTNHDNVEKLLCADSSEMTAGSNKTASAPLLSTLRRLAKDAGSNADATVQNLVAEILQLLQT